MVKITIYNLDNKLKPPVIVKVRKYFGSLSVLITVLKISWAISRTYDKSGIVLHVDKSSQLAYDVAFIDNNGNAIIGMLIEEEEDADFSYNPA